jgi:DNA topoisomerase-1
MENKLDEIQTGNDSRSKILTDFYSSLLNEIDTFNKDPKVVVEKIEPVKTGEKCPVCGADLVIREGRYGKFIGCSNYPTCSYIKKEPKKEAEKVGGELVYRDSRKGRFIACSNFPKCRYTESIAKDETSNDENKSAKD